MSTGHKVAGKKPGAALAGAAARSWRRRTSAIRPTSACFGTRSAASRGRRRGPARAAAKALYGRAGTAPRWSARPEEVPAFLAKSLKLAAKAEGSLEPLRAAGRPPRVLSEIRRLIDHVVRFAFRTARRVLKEEAVPHGEKLFPVFEEHTRWIAKGKAGKPVELGVPVCIVEDGHGFIPGHEIMWTGGDTDVAVPLVGRCREAFPDLRACSFDRGFLYLSRHLTAR